MNRPKFFHVALLVAGFAATALSASTLRAELIVYTADLNGSTVPNNSPGTGLTEVDYDDVAHTLRVQVTFSDLSGTTTVAHIHSPTDAPFTGTTGVATETPTFSGFPAGVTAGTYDHTFDLTQSSSFNPAYITAHGGTPASAEADLVASFAAGTSYLNIHTSVAPGGEIRGFLAPVPEPSTLVLLGAGALGLLGVRRRKIA